MVPKNLVSEEIPELCSIFKKKKLVKLGVNMFFLAEIEALGM
jgi:hypothetical protein